METLAESESSPVVGLDALKDLSSLRSELSELHHQLALCNESNADLHSKIEALHDEKMKAFSEVEDEMKRTESEAAKRREAEAKVRAMEANIKSLAASNDTVRFFQESESRRRSHEATIGSLRKQLADAAVSQKALQRELEASKRQGEADSLAADRAHSSSSSSSTKKGVRWSEAEGHDDDGMAEEWRRLPGKSRDVAGHIDQALSPKGSFRHLKEREDATEGEERLDDQGDAPAATGVASGTVLAALPPKSPRECELEDTVDALKYDVLDLSEVLLNEREQTATRFEECLDVVEDAELTAEAAREIGEEAEAEARFLESEKERVEEQTSGLWSHLEEVKGNLREAEAELLELRLENEALRAQLESNGIEPQVSWWMESLRAQVSAPNGGSAPNALRSGVPPFSSSTSTFKLLEEDQHVPPAVVVPYNGSAKMRSNGRNQNGKTSSSTASAKKHTQFAATTRHEHVPGEEYASVGDAIAAEHGMRGMKEGQEGEDSRETQKFGWAAATHLESLAHSRRQRPLPTAAAAAGAAAGVKSPSRPLTCSRASAAPGERRGHASEERRVALRDRTSSVQPSPESMEGDGGDKGPLAPHSVASLPLSPRDRSLNAQQRAAMAHALQEWKKQGGED